MSIIPKRSIFSEMQDMKHNNQELMADWLGRFT
jgi:hypothetical protein